MNNRWFLWGLANGVFVLAFAGGFWFGLAAAHVRPGPILSLILVGQVAIIAGGFWLRRKAAGFRIAEIRDGDDHQRQLLRAIGRAFMRVAIFEALLATTAVGLCVAFGHRELMWPALGIAISLHFAPLGRIFHLRPYYMLAAAGSCAGIIAVASFSEPERTVFLGCALGAILWITAAYAIVRSDALTRRAVQLFA